MAADGPTPLTAPAHAFVDDLDRPELTPDDAHHLTRVLRLRPGSVLTVSDGAGGWRPCRLGDGLEPVGGIEREPRPHPQLTIAFAPVKGERPEWTVQKLTEVGVDRIVVMPAARSVVRWSGERGTRHLGRLARVAREAAMQSRRVWLPLVEAAPSVATMAAEPGAALAERGGAPLGLATPTVLIGPEGGWDAVERALPVPRVDLGPLVLRAETAAVVAGAVLSLARSRRDGSNDSP